MEMISRWHRRATTTTFTKKKNLETIDRTLDDRVITSCTGTITG